MLLDLTYRESCLKAMKGVSEVYALAANMGGIGFIESNKAVIVRDNTLINHHTIEGAAPDPLPEQQRQTSLLGVGVGLRVKLLGRVSGDLDVASAFDDAGSTKVGDTRIHVRLSTDF